MRVDRVDDLDRALVHALQIDGRAPFRRIGEVLGVSDQTIARRYSRLRKTRNLRVLALTDPAVIRDRQWLLRIRAVPEAAAKIADAISQRPDTSWISLCSGGTEIVAFAYGDSVDSLLFEVMPRTRTVLDVRADEVLHVFYGGAGEPFTKQGPLDAEQVARLAEHVPAVSSLPPELDSSGRRILAELRRDGRATVEQLMAATGSSSSTVRRRLQDLRVGGVVHFDLDVNLDVFGLPVRTLLWLTIGIDELTAAGAALGATQAVAFAAATTGPANLFATVSTHDTKALWVYLTCVVAALPGVRHVETAPAMRLVKGAALRYRQPSPHAARTGAQPDASSDTGAAPPRRAADRTRRVR